MFSGRRPRFILIVVAGLEMLPATLARGIRSNIQRPLATVDIGGLFATLFLTLVALPAGAGAAFVGAPCIGCHPDGRRPTR